MSGGLPSVAHVVVAVDLDQPDLAELPLADDPVAGLDQVRRAAALGADLHDPLVLAGGGEHGLALDHVDADRLLDVDVGPGLDGGDHRQGVPVVGRGDQDDVEVLLLEHLAVVGVGARRLLRRLPVGDHARRPRRASSCRRRRARRPRPARPGSAGTGRTCRTSRSRSGRRASAARRSSPRAWRLAAAERQPGRSRREGIRDDSWQASRAESEDGFVDPLESSEAEPDLRWGSPGTVRLKGRRIHLVKRG